MNVYDGADEPVPQMGVVKLAIRSDSFDVLPTTLKTQITNFLKDKTPIGIRTDIVDPTFINIDVHADVKYNRNATDDNVATIQTAVETTIDTFNSDNLDDFFKTFRKSKLIEKINETKTSILSCDVTVRMMKLISPQANVAFDETLIYNQPFKRDNPVEPVDQGEFVSFSTPSVESEPFVFQNITGASIRDNGAGALQVVTANLSSIEVLSSNVGTVDYDLGQIVVSNLIINSYSSGASSGTLKIFARPKDQDIEGKRNDVIRIRTNETNVTVIELRE